MSSCSWPSASTPGRDGSSSGVSAACIHAATSTGRSPITRRPTAPSRPGSRGCASSARSRAPSTRTWRSRSIQPGGWLAPHVHSFEEALYILDGELLLEIAGTVHRLLAGRLRADADRLPPRARQQQRCAGQHAVARVAAAARLRMPAERTPSSSRRRTWPRWTRPRPRPPFGDPTLRLVGHYDGTGPQLETLRIKDEARGRAPGRAGHRAGRLQRHLREDARRPPVRRGPRDDVHGRLRARRRRPGPRPPVRGGVRLPRRRGRGRVRRPALHLQGRATSRSPPTGSVHGFYNTGDERVRWIETQAPQPPARHSYRWIRDWERYETTRTEERS